MKLLRHVGWQALFELEKLKEKKGGLHGCRCQRVVTLSFVHGNTAHLATCEACAAKHFGRYDQIYINDSDTDDDDNVRTEKCPVCRQRIELIVKQF